MNVAADSTSGTAAWFTLIGALGGVLLTSTVALVTATLNHRWQTQSRERQALEEHVKYLRQERRETYAHYWSAWNRFQHDLQALRAEAQKHRRPTKDGLKKRAPQVVERAWTAEVGWREAADAVLLIGSQTVVDAATDHFRTTDARLCAAWNGEGHPDQSGTWQKLFDAMRSELLHPPTR
jgi:hypothetical protein